MRQNRPRPPEDIRTDGVFVEAGSSASESEIGAAVSTLRQAGENVSIVVLSEEPVAGATVFADAVNDAGGRGLVVVIAPDSVGFSGTLDFFTVSEINAALDVARGDDAEFAATFADALTDEAGAPSATGGGGRATILVVVLLIGLGGIALVWWMNRRAKKSASSAADVRMAESRKQVQIQIDALANDILELEDEVRMADDSRADRFFEDASETYGRIGDLASSATPGDLLEISNDLDEAIWQLDSAEAIVDGNQLPKRPDRRTLTPEPTATMGPAPVPVRPVPEYRRRSTRRSSYSAGTSADVLTMLGGAVLAGRSRSGGGVGGSATSRSRRRTTAERMERPRGSGGKRVRGGRGRRG